MESRITLCDGCEKPIALNNETKGVYHYINLNFTTKYTDENTGMVEEIQTMRRSTEGIYCNECFTKLTSKIQEFLEEVGPTYKNVSQETISGRASEISEESKLSLKAEKNFKASTGTILVSDKENSNVSDNKTDNT